MVDVLRSQSSVSEELWIKTWDDAARWMADLQAEQWDHAEILKALGPWKPDHETVVGAIRNLRQVAEGFAELNRMRKKEQSRG